MYIARVANIWTVEITCNWTKKSLKFALQNYHPKLNSCVVRLRCCNAPIAPLPNHPYFQLIFFFIWIEALNSKGKRRFELLTEAYRSLCERIWKRSIHSIHKTQYNSILRNCWYTNQRRISSLIWRRRKKIIWRIDCRTNENCSVRECRKLVELRSIKICISREIEIQLGKTKSRDTSNGAIGLGWFTWFTFYFYLKLFSFCVFFFVFVVLYSAMVKLHSAFNWDGNDNGL